MNVLKEHTDVKNTATIPLVVIFATVVDLVIDFTVMATCVKVSNYWRILSNILLSIFCYVIS